MSRTATAILAFVLLLAAAGAIWFLQGGDDTPASDGAATDPRVRVSSPRANALAASPMAVRGEARGQWYFEGDFPVRLLDGNGREIAHEIARADGEWMTDQFVPFGVRLTFEEPPTGTGLLVLDRSNPSGLAENAALAAIPVRFTGSAPPKMAVRVFFNRTASGDDRCEAVWPVPRAVEPTEDGARAALGELLVGPTPPERDRGFATSIPGGVKIRSLRIEDGTAHADFDSTLKRVAGSCRVLAIRAQIERTLLRLPAVEDVVISVEGGVETALQP